MTDLHDKVALVTGGAGGFGQSTARALAEQGAIVVVADIDADGAERVAAEVDGHHLRMDVSKFEDNEAAVQFAEDKAGRLDFVFLNAGIVTGCGLGEDFDVELYRRAMGVNLDGVVYGTHAALPALKRAGGGAIVATASLAGLTGTPYDPVYCANKHGVVGLARALGPALAQDGIRFNAICPGFSETPIIASIRDGLIAEGMPIIPAEQVADAVVELFTNDSNGECWFVQAGRDASPFMFRGIPGPRPTTPA